MGGKALVLKSKEQRIQAHNEGHAAGIREKALQVYNNCIDRGMTKEDALAIAGITEADLEVKE